MLHRQTHARPLDDLLTGSGMLVKSPVSKAETPPHVIGPYALFAEIASGGMGVVHLGRKTGPTEFEPVVAIKRAHPNLAADPDFVAMFREEIRLHASILHENVARVLDVVEAGDELLLVMEYVHGQSLSGLLRQAREFNQSIPAEICVAIACGVLNGLHAAHLARSSNGEQLGIVHRDVSPQNVLVGCDGVVRVLDFGVAKARTSSDVTRAGQVKGKLGYIAPEHILGKKLDGRADQYAASVVLWEMLAAVRLFGAKRDAETVQDILAGNIPRPSVVSSRRIPGLVEGVLLRGLATDPAQRFASAREMALALEGALEIASPEAVGDWVTSAAHATLVQRSRHLAWAENCRLSAAAPAAESTADEQTLVGALSAPAVSEPEFDDSLEQTVVEHHAPDDSADLTLYDARFTGPALSAPPRAVAEVLIASPTSVDTQPGGHRIREQTKVRRGLLYAAALAAALSIANNVSHGALVGGVRAHFAPVPAQIAAAPAAVRTVEPAAPARETSTEAASAVPVAAVVDSTTIVPEPAPSASSPVSARVVEAAKLPVAHSARQNPPVRRMVKPKQVSVDGF